MFNFFRNKEKPDDFIAFLKEGLPDAASGPGARMGREAAEEEHIGIEVMEAGGVLPPELEEAAVLYANGKVGDAATLLNRYLLDHPESSDPQPWYMLFDLYEVSDQLEHFEDTAVDFAVKFERSPPTWAPRVQLAKGKDSLAQMNFGATFGPADRARMRRFLEDAANMHTVRVDVSRAPVPDVAYARAILECLVSLQERGIAIQLTGGGALAERLNATRQEEDLSEPAWLLLLEMLQFEGRRIEFEDAAVDYAVRFEVSPPSFSTHEPPCAAEVQSIAGVGPSGFTFPLSGVVGQAGDRQFAALKKFAEEIPCLEIDLSRVTRIDFAAIGLLLDTLIWLHNTGRKVLFKEGNELVNVMLSVVGAGQFAAILGRTRA